jgi:FkbM family methyltransferase
MRVSRAAEKLSVYWQELVFGSLTACSWRDKFSLLYYTLRFHIRNALRGGGDQRTAFTINVRIDGGMPTTLTLRPFAGDLFVFYEVLAFNTYWIAPSLLAPDDVRTIIDCGANIGITSLFFAARFPRARIFSVEPHPENFALLEANVARVPRITPIRACLTGTVQGSVRFTVDQAAWGNSISTGTCGVMVPATTIENLCNQNGISKIDLLKLDIEGAEEQVLKNGTFLTRTQNIIAELHGQYGFERFRRDIAPYGFEARNAHPPDTFMITASRS